VVEERNMQVALIQVPYMVGDERHSASDGPQHLLQKGAENIFSSKGFAVSVDRVERNTAYRDSASASLAVNKNLKTIVQRAVAAEQVPIVLAGSCDVSAGILAGFDHSRCGIVWLDAHGDLASRCIRWTSLFVPRAVVYGYELRRSPPTIPHMTRRERRCALVFACWKSWQSAPGRTGRPTEYPLSKQALVGSFAFRTDPDEQESASANPTQVSQSSGESVEEDVRDVSDNPHGEIATWHFRNSGAGHVCPSCYRVAQFGKRFFARSDGPCLGIAESQSITR
jgi:hypothetical protein